MLKRNKKNVLIGVCALAGVALTSVGFATWIVGVQRNNMDVEINTEIDSVQSDTKYLTVVAGSDAKVQIGEANEVKKTKVTDIVGVGTGKDGVALYSSPLKFTLESVSLKLGIGVTKPTHLKFELKSTKADEKTGAVNMNTNNIADATTVKLGDATRGTANTDGSYNYLSYSEEIKLDFDSTSKNMDKDDEKSNQSYETFNFQMEKLGGQMEWGSFFNSKKPSEFYNSVYSNPDTAFDTLLDASAKANEEIKTMYDAFNGGKLTISVSLIG